MVEKHGVSKQRRGIAVLTQEIIHLTQRENISVFSDSVETVFIKINKLTKVLSEKNIIPRKLLSLSLNLFFKICSSHLFFFFSIIACKCS